MAATLPMGKDRDAQDQDELSRLSPLPASSTSSHIFSHPPNTLGAVSTSSVSVTEMATHADVSSTRGASSTVTEPPPSSGNVDRYAWHPVGYERAQRQRERGERESLASGSEEEASKMTESMSGIGDVCHSGTATSPERPQTGEGEGVPEARGSEYMMFGGLVFWPGPPSSADSSYEEETCKQSQQGYSDSFRGHALQDLSDCLLTLGIANGQNQSHHEEHMCKDTRGVKTGTTPCSNTESEHRDDAGLCRSSTMPELSRVFGDGDGELEKDKGAEAEDDEKVTQHLGHHASTMINLHGFSEDKTHHLANRRNEPDYNTMIPYLVKLVDDDGHDNGNDVIDTAASFGFEENVEAVHQRSNVSQSVPNGVGGYETQLAIVAEVTAQETGRLDSLPSVDSGLGSVSDYILMPEADAKSVSSSEVSCRWNDARFCPMHVNQHLSLYCTDCCHLICASCFATSHMDCARVLTPNLACRDVRWQLLKLQSRVSSQISGLEKKVQHLRPVLDEGRKRSKEAKERLNEQFHQILKQLEEKHRDLMSRMEAQCAKEEARSTDTLHRTQKSILLLNYASKFLEVLRQRDSAWELLATFDARLSGVLQRVVGVAAHCLETAPPQPDTSGSDDYSLTTCQLTALQVALDGLDLGGKVASRAGDDGANAVLDGGQAADDSDALMREILSYLNRFPPPSSSTNPSSSCPGEAWQAPVGPEDMEDEVFHSDPDEQGQEHPKSFDSGNGLLCPNGGVETSARTAEYRVHQRLRPDFPEDEHRPLIADMLVTATGRLVLLDVANHCLKRVDPRQPSLHPRRLRVHQPLAMCSAGWERVLVARGGRALSVFGVGGQHVRLVASRATRQQYRGLARASDALVAGAAPDTRGVDLLDLSGRVLRSIVPMDFVRGPEVVGARSNGELLVVHQPPVPPTVIVCFDMRGQVLWQHELHVRDRHVTCSRVVGGSDGCVYYALYGDSAVYRYSPAENLARPVLTAMHGIQLPTALAMDDEGRIVVGRSDPTTMTGGVPVTTEVDFFIPRAQRRNM